MDPIVEERRLNLEDASYWGILYMHSLYLCLPMADIQAIGKSPGATTVLSPSRPIVVLPTWL